MARSREKQAERNLATLKRRETFLQENAQNRSANQELSALTWAIEELTNIYPANSGETESED